MSRIRGIWKIELMRLCWGLKGGVKSMKRDGDRRRR